MKQMIIETRQKAEELQKEALAIWRQSDRADFLEDIDKDPVFSLLMMALAYQSNEVDGEIERLKSEVLEDFARQLAPYEMGHATPATTVVSTGLMGNVPELTLGEECVFLLDGEHPFLPLLETRVLNASVQSVTRLDGRRWKVTLSFKHPVSDLSHFAFAVDSALFGDLKVTVKGKGVQLIKPWQYSELPLAPYFSIDSLTYNQGQVQTLSMLPMDLFARQNLRLFCIDRYNPQELLSGETETLDMIFEFFGVQEDFQFDASKLVLNPVILVNAQIHEATLSSGSPVVRLSGGSSDAEEKNLSARQFMHLIRPLDSQLFENMAVEVRGVAGDRFNQGSLLKLLNSIITKYRSDYYAFQHLKSGTADNMVHQLETALNYLNDELKRDVMRSVSGVYLMPRNHSNLQKREFSLSVRYLTTAGASINGLLGQGATFAAPSGFDSSQTRTVSRPVPGTDEIQDQAVMGSILRYQLLTSDRIVTMADIKLFCKKELLMRYGIADELIRKLRVSRRVMYEGAGCGYEIRVDISLTGNAFVRRNFQEKKAMAETLLQRMIEVRSTNIYPVKVEITIEEEQ